MFVILWEYRVKTDCIAEFERLYGETGPWVKLFNNGSGYLGTELLRRSDRHYLTMDRWRSKRDYESFLSAWKKEYEELDAQCENLIEEETLLGKWESISLESR